MVCNRDNASIEDALRKLVSKRKTDLKTRTIVVDARASSPIGENDFKTELATIAAEFEFDYLDYGEHSDDIAKPFNWLMQKIAKGDPSVMSVFMDDSVPDTDDFEKDLDDTLRDPANTDIVWASLPNQAVRDLPPGQREDRDFPGKGQGQGRANRKIRIPTDPVDYTPSAFPWPFLKDVDGLSNDGDGVGQTMARKLPEGRARGFVLKDEASS